MKTATPAIDRIWRRVERANTSECWPWTGATINGYGAIRTEDGTQRRVHRVVYEHLVGPIPEGLVLDHLCRNRACVNPAHLEPVTHRVNLQRGNTIAAANAAKTACKRGHEFTAENTYVKADGSRECRTCRRTHWDTNVPATH
jgi:hypothetical protein